MKSRYKGGDISALRYMPLKGGRKQVPIYTDKRTGKKVIQYQIGYRYVPDKKRQGQFVQRPKYKTEVIGKSARLARKILAKREAEWERKKCQDELGQTHQRAEYTLGELMTWYLNLPVTKKKNSYDKDIQRSKNLLRYFGSDTKADKIKPSMVESFMYEMLETRSSRRSKYSPATVNRMVALLKRTYNLAIREDMVQKNPCWKVSMLPENNKRDRVLTSYEFSTLTQELPRHILPIVCMGYYTGMRLGEILNLTWDRVNMKKGCLDLEPEDTKNKEHRTIYFNDVLWQIFMEANKLRSLHHRFVFTRNGKPIKNISTGFKNALKRAGIENFRFHDLRHTFNTNMRKAGVDQTVIMKMTGHKTNAMFIRYNTVDQDDAIKAMQRFDDFLKEQNEAESSDDVQTDLPGQKRTGSEEPVTY